MKRLESKLLAREENTETLAKRIFTPEKTIPHLRATEERLLIFEAPKNDS